MIKNYLVKLINRALVKLGPDPKTLEKNREKMHCWPCPFAKDPRVAQRKHSTMQSISIQPTLSASKIPDAEKSWPPKNPRWPPKNHIHKDSPRA